MDAYIIKLFSRFAGNPLYKNNVHKVLKGVQSIAVSFARALILIGVSFVILTPLLGMISSALKHPVDTYNPFIYLIPVHFTAQNFVLAFRHSNYIPSISLTLFIAFSLMMIQIAICSLTGYGFARFRFPGSKILFAMVIVTIVVPMQTILVPLYIQFRYVMGTNFSLLFTVWPVYIMTTLGMGLRSGLYIYIFRQFFKGLPKEIEEAALIDGAGVFYTYARIMMPNTTPAIITVGLFAFVWQYNDTFFTSTFMSNMKFIQIQIATLAATLYNLASVRDINVVRLATNAGVLLSIAPIVLVYLFMQRYFIEGIEQSGIVG